MEQLAKFWSRYIKIHEFHVVWKCFRNQFWFDFYSPYFSLNVKVFWFFNDFWIIFNYYSINLIKLYFSLVKTTRKHIVFNFLYVIIKIKIFNDLFCQGYKYTYAKSYIFMDMTKTCKYFLSMRINYLIWPWNVEHTF